MVHGLQLDLDRQRQRTEILTEELYKVRNKADQDAGLHTSRIRELENSLQTYVALEAELDDVVMQAAENAESDDVSCGEEVSFQFGKNSEACCEPLRMKKVTDIDTLLSAFLCCRSCRRIAAVQTCQRQRVGA